MIAFAVGGVWDGAVVTITTASDSDSWVATTRLGELAEVSAVTALQDLVAWAAGLFPEVATGRVIPGVAGDGRATLQLVLEGSVDEVQANAAAQTALGWPASWMPPGGLPSPVTGAVGTASAATVGFENWTRWHRGKGAMGRAGAWSGGSPTANLRRPAVHWTMSEVQVAALADAQDLAAIPRRASVYDPATRLWRFVAVADVTVELDGDMLYSVTPTVLG